ncbi:MAG: malate synthase A [Sedimenticola sp.]|nr:malate synthase A [Sedimenticola sp.]
MRVVQLKTNADTPRIRVNGSISERFEEVLTPEALQFVADLERRFGQRRKQLLGLRKDRQTRLNQGELPGFRLETREIRAADWRVKHAPSDLQDRRVEITGPVDRKQVINALNSGANCFIADFEDGHSPTWSATIKGQVNLFDAVRGTLTYTSPEGVSCTVSENSATLIVRPRGWHMEEAHLQVDGQPVSASLFDFGLFIFHNAYELLEQGSGPYLYLPKLESYIEAQLWADVFAYAEETLGLNHSSICCTVLIETILAAFEMDEILYTLRDYAVGLNCGQRDYIFSFIKRFHANPDWVLPDRDQITMASGFLQAYSHLLIKTCHRRGAHAMGGMTAQIPVKDDPAADADAMIKVRIDKEREAAAGHDGTRVAHPGLVQVAREVFDRLMPQPNQITRQLNDLEVTAEQLLALPEGGITAAGVESNIKAALHYLAAWLGGSGAVPINHLMEDAATAEIARSQLWQWIRYPKGVLEDGRQITFELVTEGVEKELEKILQEKGQATYDDGHYETAAKLLRDIIANDRFVEFLTLPAYQTLV